MAETERQIKVEEGGSNGEKERDRKGEREKEREFVCLFGWLVSERPRQLLGYIADGPQDRASDNFTCCHI